MKPSRRVTYAIQAIVLLAKLGANGPVSCGTIARQGQMPERFLLQILRELVNWGLLDSVRGVEGGYVLKRAPDSISVADVFEALGTSFIPSVPPLQALSEQCRQRIMEAFNRAASLARAELNRLTIANLVDVIDIEFEVEVAQSPNSSHSNDPSS